MPRRALSEREISRLKRILNKRRNEARPRARRTSQKDRIYRADCPLPKPDISSAIDIVAFFVVSFVPSCYAHQTPVRENHAPVDPQDVPTVLPVATLGLPRILYPG